MQGTCRPARRAKIDAAAKLVNLGRSRSSDLQQESEDGSCSSSSSPEFSPQPKKARQQAGQGAQRRGGPNKAPQQPAQRGGKQTPATGGHTTPAGKTARGRGKAAPRRTPAAPKPAPSKDFHAASDFPDPIPVRVKVADSPLYISESRLGKGGFGAVYLGRRADGAAEEPVALKFEHVSSKGCTYGTPYEWSVYNALGDVYGIPRVHHTGQQDNYYIMVMDLLGPSLWDLWNTSGQHLSEGYVARFAMEGLAILRALHAKGYVHGDVKPENFLVGPAGTEREKRLYLVDLGLAARWRSGSSGHVRYDQKPDDFRGTMRYASVHAHLGRTPSRRDDLESLAYSCLFLLKGRLPWQGYQGDNKGFLVARSKVGISAATLTAGVSAPFLRFLEAVQGLAFAEDPPYAAYLAMFEPLTNSTPERPLLITGARRVLPRTGVKRPRPAELDALTASARSTAKRLRTGTPVQQWITVYNKFKPMKQRYHCNVASNRLLVHVEKGWADGLYITSVCSCQGAWAVVMDAGSGFTSQIYRVHSGVFLPKEWIMNKWEEGYYITSLAGATNMSSLLVMSKGSKYTQQSYKVSESFPYDWIKRKWKDGFMVTAMATAANHWAVVMSRNAPYASQVVELDFAYPSEGIHARWDEGYRITATAATPDQAAFVLSQGKRGSGPPGTASGPGPLDDSQETLRTSQFPSVHVKDKWDRQLYISCMAWGRTMT